MLPSIQFKSRVWTGRRSLHVAVVVAVGLACCQLLTGCAGSRSFEPGKNDLAAINLRGPVRTMLLEVGPSDKAGNAAGAPGPREFREFDREGNLLGLVRFNGTIDDTTYVIRNYYGEAGNRTKRISGTWAGRNRWRWTREEFHYDSTGRLLWSAEYFDTARGAPHIVFCRSHNREEEAACLDYWGSAQVLKVVYLDDREVPLGEQWVRRGISEQVIHYETDTVERDGATYVTYRLPEENIDGRAPRYALDFYRENDGRLARRWEYRQVDSLAEKYTPADLTDIKTFDERDRLATEVFVGAGGGGMPIAMYSFRYDDHGNLSEKVRREFKSFDAYLKGDEERKFVDERFEYRRFDSFGNWEEAVTTTGGSDAWQGVLRRKFTYFER